MYKRMIFLLVCIFYKNFLCFSQENISDNYINSLKESFKKYDTKLLKQDEILYFKLKEVVKFNPVNVKDIKENIIESEYYMNEKNLYISNKTFDYYVLDKKVFFIDKMATEARIIDNATPFNSQKKQLFAELYLDSIRQAKVLKIDQNKIKLTFNFSKKDSSTNDELVKSIHTLFIDINKNELLEIDIQIDNKESEIIQRTYYYSNRNIVKKDTLKELLASIFLQRTDFIINELKKNNVHIINHTKN